MRKLNEQITLIFFTKGTKRLYIKNVKKNTQKRKKNVMIIHKKCGNGVHRERFLQNNSDIYFYILNCDLVFYVHHA